MNPSQHAAVAEYLESDNDWNEMDDNELDEFIEALGGERAGTLNDSGWVCLRCETAPFFSALSLYEHMRRNHVSGKQHVHRWDVLTDKTVENRPLGVECRGCGVSYPVTGERVEWTKPCT